ncbi:hypothetical protein BJ508DRAFT_416224 [Ascobolus immersus RN42]|uniref:Uncharacterized protein n=1 Tax=Ascobolus immersus RN42 TaxID=1160509 RepID=A0A3N4HYT1_ASCIM|nr:hypothetical protein BJ508DRAFT_416224 [Ascobolus immersus RN42]
MSLSTSLLAARAPVPLAFSLHRRSNDTDDSTDGSLDIPVLTCNGTRLFDPEAIVDYASKSYKESMNFEVAAFACPYTEALETLCTDAMEAPDFNKLNTTTDEEFDAALTTPKRKAHCTPVCNAVHDGSYLTESLKCLARNCDDSEKAENSKNLNRYYDEFFKFVWKPDCERMGLTKVVPVPGGVEAPVPPTDSKEDAAVKSEESSASGLRMTGGWGASVIVALAFGSVFSGFLV